MPSELHRVNQPKKPLVTLPAKLDQEQTALLLEIAMPYMANGIWPIWDYVVRRMDQREINARSVIASLPRFGSAGPMGPSYGFTVRSDWLGISDDEPVQLTIASALPLVELRPVFADPFLRVLHHMIALQRRTVPSPTAVTETWLTSQELSQAIPALSPGFIAALPQILAREPSTWRGSSRGPNPPDDLTWSRQIGRDVQRYDEAKDLESYVATACRVVSAQALEREYELYQAARDDVPSARTYLGSRWLGPSPSVEPDPQPSTQPESAGRVYVKEGLIEDMIELDRVGGFSTDKLVQLCRELNFNFQHEQPFSCHSLLRAIMDHIPPAFGLERFAQVVSNVSWIKTDQDYLKRLHDFRVQGDDVMHRPIGRQRSRIDMHDVPAPAALNHLLEGVLKRLREARDKTVNT